jgi:hypothetical protein
MYGYKERIRMKTVECFEAGVVKGVKEHGDASRYFGSTMALRGWCEETQRAGLISWDGKNSSSCKLTELGEAAYEVWRLVEMPDGRSYLWPRKTFDLEGIVPERSA